MKHLNLKIRKQPFCVRSIKDMSMEHNKESISQRSLLQVHLSYQVCPCPPIIHYSFIFPWPLSSCSGNKTLDIQATFHYPGANNLDLSVFLQCTYEKLETSERSENVYQRECLFRRNDGYLLNSYHVSATLLLSFYS